MTFSEYVGLNNPEGVNDVLIKYGYEPRNYVEDCPDAIDFVIQQNGISATEDFLRVHPDYDMIVDLDKNDNPETKTQDIERSRNVASVIPPVVVSSEIPRPVLSDSLKEILVIIMAFWLLNKIISS